MSDAEPKPIIVLPRAERDLRKLDSVTRLRVVQALRKLANGEQVDIRKLSGSNEHRVRVGAIRVRVELQENSIIVLRVLPRDHAYDR